MVALASAIRQGSRWEIRCSWPDRMHLCAHPASAPSGNRLLTGLSTPSAHTGRAEHMGYVSHVHPTHSYTPHLASLQPHHTHIPPTPSHALVPSHTSHSYMLTHTHTHFPPMHSDVVPPSSVTGHPSPKASSPCLCPHVPQSYCCLLSCHRWQPAP